jgi:hypothetical protein
MTVVLVQATKHFVGAAADVKPTGVGAGSTFLAADTGAKFVFDGTTWQAVTSGGAIAAGSAIIGKVGIDQTTPGTTDSVTPKSTEVHLGQVGSNAGKLTATITRPANATPYAAKDVVAAATLAVTGSAAGTGGVVRLTVASSAALVTGQAVTVAAVGGTTEANGNWLVTVVDGTHVELIGSVFANAWTSGGTIQPMITLLNAGRLVGGSLWIDNVRRVTTDMNDIVAHRLWFYVAQVTQPADNAVFTLLAANTGTRAGYIDLPAQTTEGAGSDVTLAQNINDRLHIICGAADRALYLVDEIYGAGYTPTTGATVTYTCTESQD